MLILSNVSKSFGGRTLLDEASLSITRGDRVGLVGPNGAGKTTLFSMILGKIEPDGGVFQLERNITLGYLPQESAPIGNETALEIAISVNDEFVKLRKLVMDWDSVPHSELEELDHDRIFSRFDELGGYQVEPKAKRILKGLGFRDSDFDRPARELSGGWVMRAHLARLLVMEPDLLMLDEPTNHLDLEALLWFQNYLKSYPGALFVISHDRSFLNELVNSIVEVRLGRLDRYTGTYDDFLRQKEERQIQRQAAYENQQKEIQRLQRFVDRFGSKASKASQAQSKLKQIERMDLIEAPEAAASTVQFQFPQPKRSGQRVMTLKGLDFAYGEKKVYEGLNFQVERGEKTGLVGPNGAGKSTLLKLLAGVLEAQEGARELGHEVKVGYFSQNRAENLNLKNTVLEETFQIQNPSTEQMSRNLLGAFLFRGDDVFKKVGLLSGGEKSRLALVKILLDPPNFLLLDEPTTHLDIPSIDALIQALKSYTGSLYFVSHDVHFIRSIGDHIVHVESGKITRYPGGYDYYLEKTGAINAQSSVGAAGLNTTVSTDAGSDKTDRKQKTKEQKRIEAEARVERSRIRKKQEQVVKAVEGEIEKLESRSESIHQELLDPEVYERPDRAKLLNQELKEIQDRLPGLHEQWEKEATQLESL